MNYIEKIIERQKEIIGKETDGDYIKSMNPQDNLLRTINNWSDIEKDFRGSQGGELKKDKDGRKKFCSVRSSSALCVNNFAPFKESRQEIHFIYNGNSNFDKAKFEMPLSTGISTPNLDFYLENINIIIGFESKFTEHFEKNIAHTKANLCKYFMREELYYLPRLFDGLILHYINCTDKMYLDVAQLIKHLIGLINNKKNRKAILVYIYWEPINWKEISIFEQHRKELDDFAKRIEKFEDVITFKSLSYSDFWKEYENCELLKEHIKLMRGRYNFAIDKE